MTNFRTVRDALNTLLGSAAAGRFAVVGFRRQGLDAAEIKGHARRVQVYYSQGDFPKSAGRNTGPSQHDMTFNIDIQVSQPAAVDLNTINNPASSPSQIATALAAMQESAERADESFDELADILYQILMDGRNYDIGLGKGVVANRWINSIRKDDPQPMGGLVVLTGRLEYVCRTVEEITGDTGVALTGGIDVTLDIVDDDVERTGVIV